MKASRCVPTNGTSGPLVPPLGPDPWDLVVSEMKGTLMFSATGFLVAVPELLEPITPYVDSLRICGKMRSRSIPGAAGIIPGAAPALIVHRGGMLQGSNGCSQGAPWKHLHLKVAWDPAVRQSI